MSRLLATFVEKFEKTAPYKFLQVHAEQRAGGRIGLHYPLISSVYNQDRLGGKLKQEPVTLLSATDARVFPLHRLLSVSKALLQDRHGA